MTDDTTITRRTAIQAAGAALAAGVGAAGIAAGTEHVQPGDCVVTNTYTRAYDSCPPGYHVWDLEEGTYGTVEELCTDIYGDEWAKVYFNCIGRTYTVDSDNLDRNWTCYC